MAGRRPDSPHLFSRATICKSLSVHASTFDQYAIVPDQIAEDGTKLWSMKTIVAFFVQRSEVSDIEKRKLVADMEAAELKVKRLRIDLAVTEGKQVPIETLQIVLQRFSRECAPLLDALPARVKERAPSLTSGALDKVRAVVVDMQNKLSNLDRVMKDILEDLE